LRGSGRFPLPGGPGSPRPSPISIPFIAGQWSLHGSARTSARSASTISIPFIAGQWSLRAARAEAEARARISIPFIAGQWSLLPGLLERVEEGVVFQSPSLRGSGRFQLWRSSPPRSPYDFNPLHCGAVVASRQLPTRCHRLLQFQSPSLRGSGRFAFPK